jgi:hypothetical protein
MTSAKLAAAIAEANRVFSRKNGATPEVPVEAPANGGVAECSPTQSWPPESLDAERRFAQPHAKLFPFLGRKVRTPDGPGTLLQVFADRVTVVLDSELHRCSFFAPGAIEPMAWESE